MVDTSTPRPSAASTATSDNDIQYLPQAGGCFIKGTIVHAKDGFKPIEEINVGDYVLSSPEDGSGSPEYKRVLKTLIHEQKTIVHLSISRADAAIRDFLAATSDQPFWVDGAGWTRADN